VHRAVRLAAGERDRANLAVFLTQLYRDLTDNPLAMLPATEPLDPA